MTWTAPHGHNPAAELNHKATKTQRGWRRNQRNLTAENAKSAEVESILFVFSAFFAVEICAA